MNTTLAIISILSVTVFKGPQSTTGDLLQLEYYDAESTSIHQTPLYNVSEPLTKVPVGI